MDHCRILYFVTDLPPIFVPAFMLDGQVLGQPGYRGLDDALNEIRGVALYEGVGTYSRDVAIALTPITGRGSMDVGSPSEREIDVKDGSHCLIELVGALV